MDGKPNPVPCVKTGERLPLTKVRLQWDVLRRANRFGWIRSPKELVEEQIVLLDKETPEIVNSILSESRHETIDSYNRRIESEDDNDEEDLIRPHLLKKKRNIEDLPEDDENALPLSSSSLQDGPIHAGKRQKSSCIQNETTDLDVIVIDSPRRSECVVNSGNAFSTTPANANNVRCAKQTTTKSGEHCQNKRASITGKQHISQHKEAFSITKEITIFLKPVKTSSNAMAAIRKKTKEKEISSREDARISRESAKDPYEKYDSDGIHAEQTEKLVQVEALRSEQVCIPHTPTGEMQLKNSKILECVRKGICEKDTLQPYLSKEKTNEELNSEKFQTLLKNAVVEGVFRSPEAEEEKNKIQALKREVELLELKNRQLQDVTTEIKSRITTLKKGLDRKSCGTQVNMDVALKPSSKAQEDLTATDIPDVVCIGAQSRSDKTQPSRREPENRVAANFSQKDFSEIVCKSIAEVLSEITGHSTKQKQTPIDQQSKENNSDKSHSMRSGLVSAQAYSQEQSSVVKTSQTSSFVRPVTVKKEPKDLDIASSTSSLVGQTLPNSISGRFGPVDLSSCTQPPSTSQSLLYSSGSVPCTVQYSQRNQLQTQTLAQQCSQPISNKNINCQQTRPTTSFAHHPQHVPTDQTTPQSFRKQPRKHIQTPGTLLTPVTSHTKTTSPNFGSSTIYYQPVEPAAVGLTSSTLNADNLYGNLRRRRHPKPCCSTCNQQPQQPKKRAPGQNQQQQPKKRAPGQNQQQQPKKQAPGQNQQQKRKREKEDETLNQNVWEVVQQQETELYKASLKRRQCVRDYWWLQALQAPSANRIPSVYQAPLENVSTANLPVSSMLGSKRMRTDTSYGYGHSSGNVRDERQRPLAIPPNVPMQSTLPTTPSTFCSPGLSSDGDFLEVATRVSSQVCNSSLKTASIQNQSRTMRTTAVSNCGTSSVCNSSSNVPPSLAETTTRATMWHSWEIPYLQTPQTPPVQNVTKISTSETRQLETPPTLTVDNSSNVQKLSSGKTVTTSISTSPFLGTPTIRTIGNNPSNVQASSAKTVKVSNTSMPSSLMSLVVNNPSNKFDSQPGIYSYETSSFADPVVLTADKNSSNVQNNSTNPKTDNTSETRNFKSRLMLTSDQKARNVQTFSMSAGTYGNSVMSSLGTSSVGTIDNSFTNLSSKTPPVQTFDNILGTKEASMKVTTIQIPVTGRIDVPMLLNVDSISSNAETSSFVKTITVGSPVPRSVENPTESIVDIISNNVEISSMKTTIVDSSVTRSVEDPSVSIVKNISNNVESSVKTTTVNSSVTRSMRDPPVRIVENTFNEVEALAQTTTVDSSVTRSMEDPSVSIVANISNNVESSVKTTAVDLSVTHSIKDPPVSIVENISNNVEPSVKTTTVDSSVTRSMEDPSVRIVENTSNNVEPSVKTTTVDSSVTRSMKDPSVSTVANTSNNVEPSVKTTTVNSSVTRSMEDPPVSTVENISNNVESSVKTTAVDLSVTHSIKDPPVSIVENISNNVEPSVKTTTVDSSVTRSMEDPSVSIVANISNNVESSVTTVDLSVTRSMEDSPVSIVENTSNVEPSVKTTTVDSSVTRSMEDIIENISNDLESSVKTTTVDSSVTRSMEDIVENISSSLESSVKTTTVDSSVTRSMEDPSVSIVANISNNVESSVTTVDLSVTRSMEDSPVSIVENTSNVEPSVKTTTVDSTATRSMEDPSVRIVENTSNNVEPSVKTTTVDSSVTRSMEDPSVSIVANTSNNVEPSVKTTTVDSSVTRSMEDPPVSIVENTSNVEPSVKTTTVDSTATRSMEDPSVRIVENISNNVESSVKTTAVDLLVTHSIKDPPVSIVANISNNVESSVTTVDLSVTRSMEDSPVSIVENTSNVEPSVKTTTVDSSVTRSMEDIIENISNDLESSVKTTTVDSSVTRSMEDIVENISSSLESSVKTTTVDSSVTRSMEDPSVSIVANISNNVESSVKTTAVDLLVTHSIKDPPVSIVENISNNVEPSVKTTTVDSSVTRSMEDPSVSIVANISNNVESSVTTVDLSVTRSMEDSPVSIVENTSNVEPSVKTTTVDSSVTRSMEDIIENISNDLESSVKTTTVDSSVTRSMEYIVENISSSLESSVKTTTVDPSVTRSMKDPPVRIIENTSNDVEALAQTATIDSSVTHSIKSLPISSVGNNSSKVETSSVKTNIGKTSVAGWVDAPPVRSVGSSSLTAATVQTSVLSKETPSKLAVDAKSRNALNVSANKSTDNSSGTHRLGTSTGLEVQNNSSNFTTSSGKTVKSILATEAKCSLRTPPAQSFINDSKNVLASSLKTTAINTSVPLYAPNVDNSSCNVQTSSKKTAIAITSGTPSLGTQLNLPVSSTPIKIQIYSAKTDILGTSMTPSLRNPLTLAVKDKLFNIQTSSVKNDIVNNSTTSGVGTLPLSCIHNTSGTIQTPSGNTVTTSTSLKNYSTMVNTFPVQRPTVTSSQTRSIDSQPVLTTDSSYKNVQTSSARISSTLSYTTVNDTQKPGSTRNTFEKMPVLVLVPPLPPHPKATVALVKGNVVLTWNMTKASVPPIANYEICSYLVEDLQHVTGNDPWRCVATLKATQLPMACLLTEFKPGLTYCFAVRAVDIYGRKGPLSPPNKVKIENDAKEKDEEETEKEREKEKKKEQRKPILS